MQTDRIQESTVLDAPVRLVWQAIADSAEFGLWFGMKIDGAFEAGRRLPAVIAPTTADPDIAAAQKAYEGVAFDLRIEQIVPERLLSFRWTHPIEGCADPSTLVTFTVEARDGGTALSVVESDFNNFPVEHRAARMAENAQGWAIQMRLIRQHLNA